MAKTTPEQNKALVLEAFDTLVNKRYQALMGLDPSLIAITREAFAPHRYPLAHGIAPTDITVRVDGQAIAISELAARHGSVFSLPAGWKGHCELTPVAAQP